MNTISSMSASLRAGAVMILLPALAAVLGGCRDGREPAGAGASASAAAEAGAGAAAAALPAVIRLDYANWSPISLVLRSQGFLEQEFAADGVQVEWVFSQGSNKSMEFLRSASIDIGSSAGVAALISFANGNPIETVYISTTPEWTALLTAPGSGITTLEGLRGRSIAATPGTDPYVFMIRSLSLAGLTLDDVSVVTLQHPDGKNELMRGRVDAWAGLDPLMAQAELEGAAYLYRNVAYNTFNVISVRREFARAYPEAVTRVLRAYEQARSWARAHPREYLELVVSAARLTAEVGRLLLERTALEDAAPGAKLRATLLESGRELQKSGVIRADADVGQLLEQLLVGSYFEALQ